MDLGMTKWILAGLIECDSATNLSSPGSWAVSPALNSSFPSPTPTSCATQMHSARVQSCAKGQEVLPPGQHNTIPGSWGEKRICQVQIREGWFDLFHYWWKLPGGLCASRLIGLFCNSVSCGEHGAHITLVFGSSATFPAWVAVFFSVCFFCFHPQPIKTLWSAQRYSSAVHTPVLLLPETKGRRCGSGALWYVPSKTYHNKMVWILVSGKMAPPVSEGDGDSL